ncbi:hyalin-like [Patiria miniata]|uniref:HYR domain-containing protein n=1 Tax=Patiria miniata TaxID=46514 RepID=A0A914B9W9_PATMI|nr:hyalin-like [Patiria miniata]
MTVTTDPSLATAIAVYGRPSVSDNSGGPVSVAYSQLPGSVFNYHPDVEHYVVTGNATDRTGNLGRCNFFVKVVDLERPVITCRSDMIVGSNNESTVVDYLAGIDEFVMTDNSGFALEGPNCSWPGSAQNPVFYKGVTIVNCTVTDQSGNVGSCTFTVNVIGLPVMKCSNLLVPTDQGVADATVDISGEWGKSIIANDALNQSLAVQSCSEVDVVVLSWNPNVTDPGRMVTCTSEPDRAQEQAECSFYIKVVDLEKPVVSCRSDMVESTPDESTVVDYLAGIDEFVMTDNSGLTPAGPDCSWPTGSAQISQNPLFHKGVTIVSCNVTDQSGNIGSCTFTVNVIGVPTILCPESSVSSPIRKPTDPGSYLTSLPSDFINAYNISAKDSNSAPLAMEYCKDGIHHLNGHQLSYRVQQDYTFICKSEPDHTGQFANCTIFFKVVDEEPPMVVCPDGTSSIEYVPIPSASVPTIDAQIQVTDNAQLQAPTAGCTITSSGITCTATDDSGNVGRCSFYRGNLIPNGDC